MKKLLAGLLVIASLSSLASQNNYFCKESYDKKISRMNNKDVFRFIGTLTITSGMTFGALVSGIGLPALVFGAPGGTIGFVAVATAGNFIFDDDPAEPYAGVFRAALNFDREDGLRAASQLLDLISYTKEELREMTYEEYKTIEPNAEYENYSQVTLMDVLLEKVNWERSVSKKRPFSYEELRKHLLAFAKLDTFCPFSYGKHRPRTIRQIKKIIDELK